ncbi:glycosyltransferase [Microbacterium ulmi]|uniref:Glycosyltransferase n=1 Tax=Microbacterium ulmi TaxID=179095 RepID=A0A7Y2LZI3_9MICO|nr:glycosyltransferase [Microbacterium ulmi]NII70345.1 glycosyltransferase involved in cell wall biosynthesis [Microbacterium ulmi]NNH03392.1 glycosyltransferase [Microbacterium ulmi]
MTTTLRVVLDQLVAPTDPDLRTASRELAQALVQTAPRGCVVEAVVPSASEATDVGDLVAGLADVRKTALARRELAAAVQLGAPTGIGGGMIHSPSLFAPLVRHDRVHDNDQTVVTLWDLRPWEAPDELPRATAMWHRAMLKRAVKYADAVVVPTHAVASRLAELAPKLGDRVRVIAGAAPAGFSVPRDDVGRRRALGLPEGFILLSGGMAPSDGLERGFAAIAASGLDVPVVVIDAAEGEEPAIAELASASGIPETHVHVRCALDTADRAAVFGAAVVFGAPSRRTAFPWRVVEALALGVPVVAADSAVHVEVIVDGGILVEDRDAAAAALVSALGSTSAAERLAVLASDRGRAFSWREAATRVWELHAEL